MCSHFGDKQEACKNLERLNLSHNGIGEKGVCDLAQALSGGACPALACLDLRNNNFGPRGAVCIQACDAHM